MATVDVVRRARPATLALPPAAALPRAGGYAVAAGAVAVVPLVLPSIYVNAFSRVVAFALFALSINVLVGYAGQVSLGHNAFIGVGAFGSAYMLTEMALPFPVAIVGAATTGALAALLLGGIALRIRGLYLALVTLAYGVFSYQVVFNIREFTGGGAGMMASRPAPFSGDVSYAYLCLGALAIALLLDWRLTASRVGRAIQAIRDNERVAASWGVNVTAYKLFAFVISGIMAGVAGALFASIEGLAHREEYAPMFALSVLLIVVLGGVGSRIGVIQGAAIVAMLPTLLDWAHDNTGLPIDGSLAPLIIALLVLLVLVFVPGGIAGLERSLVARIRARLPTGSSTVSSQERSHADA